ncbi:Innexin inx2 [Orchesella cincta]|uniref:Innexin n=1 Tax=Orchesella cincta TaxID=48709 RepID=A0A1D2M531_ORCCI|nr:Innexin inx2 [Orchesella cincta]
MDIWKNLKDVVQVDNRHVSITNFVFILHSKVSVFLLLCFSILVTSRQYLGDPIDCSSSADIKSIADKYCWIHSTFTRGALISDGKWGYEVVEQEESEIAPGIRPSVEQDSPRVYHTYYQWVWLVLFLQAALFYIPYWSWKMCDRGRIKMLVSDLNMEVIMAIDDDKLLRQKEVILAYLTPNIGSHTRYATHFIICEILNCANVIAQIFVTDAFLNHSFSSYGLELFSLSQKHPYQRSDDLARVFPTVTACRIATGGVAFGTMEYDLLCVLPINILNEKIYIFLWFWFLGLAALSILNLCYRLVVVLFPALRRVMLQRRTRKSYTINTDDKFYLSYPDWFLLTTLAENLNPVVFSEILNGIQNNVDDDYDDDDSPSTLTAINKNENNDLLQ